MDLFPSDATRDSALKIEGRLDELHLAKCDARLLQSSMDDFWDSALE